MWCVAMTKPNAERIDETNLVRQGYYTYLPKIITKIGKETRIRPLFPRYIFIQIEDKFHSINSTIGVSYLIMNELKPAAIPDEVIQTLKDREHNGVITLPQKGKFHEGENVKL